VRASFARRGRVQGDPRGPGIGAKNKHEQCCGVALLGRGRAPSSLRQTVPDRSNWRTPAVCHKLPTHERDPVNRGVDVCQMSRSKWLGALQPRVVSGPSSGSRRTSSRWPPRRSISAPIIGLVEYWLHYRALAASVGRSAWSSYAQLSFEKSRGAVGSVRIVNVFAAGDLSVGRRRREI